MPSPRDLAVRGGVLVLSLFLCAAGTSLYVNAALGSDPLTALIQGLGACFQCSYGLAMNVMNAAALLLVWALDRHYIHLGTVLSLALGGVVSDWLIGGLAALLPPAPPLPLRAGLMLAGTVCIGLGVGMYQAAQLGCSPLDALNQIAAKRAKIPLRYERMIFDGLCLVGALLLGGVVGLGTVVSMLLVGPIMAGILHRLSPIIDRCSAPKAAGDPKT